MSADICAECLDHLAANPSIIGACASVGIERAMTTPQMVQAYMHRLHVKAGHE